MRKKYYAVVAAGIVRMQKAKDEDEASRLAFGMVSSGIKAIELSTNKVEAYKKLDEMGLN